MSSKACGVRPSERGVANFATLAIRIRLDFLLNQLECRRAMKLALPGPPTAFLQRVGLRSRKLAAAAGAAMAKFGLGRRLQQLYLTPVSAALALLCAILGIWWSYEVLAAPPVLEPPKIALPKRASASVIIKQFVPQSLDRYSIIDEKSVFSPLRQAIKSAREAAAQTRQPPSFILVGVIMSGEERIAITKAPGSNASVTVTPGQTIEGWEVVSIAADHIELRADAQTVVLPLYPPSQKSGNIDAGQAVDTGQQPPPNSN